MLRNSELLDKTTFWQTHDGSKTCCKQLLWHKFVFLSQSRQAGKATPMKIFQDQNKEKIIS